MLFHCALDGLLMCKLMDFGFGGEIMRDLHTTRQQQAKTASFSRLLILSSALSASVR